MWTQHRIDTEKLYFLAREKNNTDTKEDILVASDINLINMINAFTNFAAEFIVSKIYEIFALLIINTKLLKGNRLLNTTPEAVTRRCSVKKVFLQIS